MKELKEKAKIDNRLMGLTKVGEIRHVIAHTDKGDLCLVLRKGETEKDYRFILDAVPYDEKTNREIMQMFNGVLFTF